MKNDPLLVTFTFLAIATTWRIVPRCHQTGDGFSLPKWAQVRRGFGAASCRLMAVQRAGTSGQRTEAVPRPRGPQTDGGCISPRTQVGRFTSGGKRFQQE